MFHSLYTYSSTVAQSSASKISFDEGSIPDNQFYSQSDTIFLTPNMRDSLKKTTREKRGSGERRKVTPCTRIPSDWKGFLRVSNNKDELFKLLATKVVSLKLSAGKTIFATHGENVLSSAEMPDMSSLSPCTHEEADTRMIIHAFDASLHGHRRTKIRSNDTDVVVLAVALLHLFQ
eukprot:gene12478-13761_t